MSIQNINMIQNIKSLSYLQNDTYEYLIQSLANLGQRIGLKGDAVEYSSFTFRDIFDEEIIDDSSNKIGVLKYEKNNDESIVGKFYIINKGEKFNKNNETNKIIYTESNVFNKQLSPNNLTFDMLMGNTKEITNDSIFQMSTENNTEYFSNVLYKIILGKENEQNNLEIEYDKYDATTNKLIYLAKAFYLYNDGVSNYYSMIELYNIDDISYKMKVYLFNSSFLDTTSSDNTTKSEFESSFSSTTYNKDNSFFNYLNLIDITNTNNIFEYNTNEECTVFGMIKNNIENNELNSNNETISLKYNIDNTSLSLDELNNDNISKSIEILSKDGLSLDSRLIFINNDITYLYPILLKYYSQNQYSSLLSTLGRRIICSIYEYLYSLDNNSEYNVMYIPLDYEIKYLGNNNKLQIYFSSNINVSFEDLSILTTDEVKEYFYAIDMITFDYNYTSKVKVLNFEVKYNTKYEDCINDIVVNNIYTNPYINSLNKWVINDTETNISALGKNAGNPNIILIYSTNNNHEILSSSNINIDANTDFIQKSFIVNEKIIPNNIKTNCKCWVPKITNKNIDLFYNSIIINMSSKDCLDKEISSSTLNIFTSFWIVTNDGVEASFNYIEDPTNVSDTNNSKYALDMSVLMNTEYILSKLIENYNNTSNEFNLILLNAINNVNYQETADNSKMNWCVIKNKLGSEYNDDYINDLNFSIQYNDTVNYNYNNVSEISQSELYLKNFNSQNITNNTTSNINVTNLLYPNIEYIAKKREVQVISYIISDIIDSNEELTNSELIQLGAEYYNESILSSNIVENKSKKIVSYTTTSYETYYEKTYLGYYNEYIFNENVPNINLKEMFLYNTNLLNRLNIITLDEYGKLYYSYLGSSYDNDDKSILHIGTSNKNINIGTNTLINESSSSYFKTQDTLSIDFDNLILNSKTLKANSPLITIQKLNSINYYNVSLRPIGKIYNNGYIRILNEKNVPIINKTTTINPTTISSITTYNPILSTTTSTTTLSNTTSSPIYDNINYINSKDIVVYDNEILYVPIVEIKNSQKIQKYYCLYLNNLFNQIIGISDLNINNINTNIIYNGLKTNFFCIQDDTLYNYFIPIYESNLHKFNVDNNETYKLLNDFLNIEFHIINGTLNINIDTIKDYTENNDSNYKYKYNFKVLYGNDAINKFGGSN